MPADLEAPSEGDGTLGTPPTATSTWQGGSGMPTPTVPAATSTPPAATLAGPSTPAATPAGVQFVTPPQLQGDELDVDHDEDAPLRFHAVDDFVGPGSQPGFAIRDLGCGRTT